MPLQHRFVLPWVLLVACSLGACGEVSTTDTPGDATDASPEATFEAMRRATLDGDWEGLYALNLPSERAEAERRWAHGKDDAGSADALRLLAEQAGLETEAVASLTLLEYFAERNAHQARTSEGRMMEIIRRAEVVGTESVDDDVVLVRFRAGEREQELPMKREDGRWYLHRVLTALTAFAEDDAR